MSGLAHFVDVLLVGHAEDQDFENGDRFIFLGGKYDQSPFSAGAVL